MVFRCWRICESFTASFWLVSGQVPHDANDCFARNCNHWCWWAVKSWFLKKFHSATLALLKCINVHSASLTLLLGAGKASPQSTPSRGFKNATWHCWISRSALGTSLNSQILPLSYCTALFTSLPLSQKLGWVAFREFVEALKSKEVRFVRSILWYFSRTVSKYALLVF